MESEHKFALKAKEIALQEGPWSFKKVSCLNSRQDRHSFPMTHKSYVNASHGRDSQGQELAHWSTSWMHFALRMIISLSLRKQFVYVFMNLALQVQFDRSESGLSSDSDSPKKEQNASKSNPSPLEARTPRWPSRISTFTEEACLTSLFCNQRVLKLESTPKAQ